MPDPDLWAELQAALSHLNNAEFELMRGDPDAAGVWLGDVRRALGGAALAATGVAAYARLASTILTCRGVDPLRGSHDS